MLCSRIASFLKLGEEKKQNNNNNPRATFQTTMLQYITEYCLGDTIYMTQNIYIAKQGL